jgi:hypothetical protein
VSITDMVTLSNRLCSRLSSGGEHVGWSWFHITDLSTVSYADLMSRHTSVLVVDVVGN